MKNFNIIKLPKYSVSIHGHGKARGDGISFGNANPYGSGDGCGYGSGYGYGYGNMYGSGYGNGYRNGYPEYPKALL
jgi:hypothetical protein